MSDNTETSGAAETPGRDFIRQIVADDLASGRHREIVTRFPPEPNGYLHIGHAKSICLNFGIAAETGGRCFLRLDDTNPLKEDQAYVDSIIDSVRWLGFDWGERLTHASDYFAQIHACALQQLVQHTILEGLRLIRAATADAMYGAIAAFGLSLLTAFLVEQQVWLGLVGGLFLCYLGVRTVTAPPVERAATTVESRSLLGAWSTTLVLTLTNPMTILAFVAIFAGAGLTATSGEPFSALLLVAGVFLGSAAWWLLLSGGVSLLRGYVNAQTLRWINRIAGAVVIAFGVVAILRGLGWV